MKGAGRGPAGRGCEAEGFEDAVALLAGGDLEGDEAARVRAHVGACLPCRRSLGELRAALAWVREADAASAPPVDAATRAALHAEILASTAGPPGGARPGARLVARLTARFDAPTGRAPFAWPLGLLASGAAAAFILVAGLGPELRPRRAVDAAAPAGPPAGVAPGSLEEEPAPAPAPETGGELASADAPDDDAWPAEPDGDRPSPRRKLKIELRTQDPTIRIVWLTPTR